MGTRSSLTQERILCEAEKLILRNGFNATNIEDILAQAAITKSGFFYHFAGKHDLAKALVQRYLRQDEQLFSSLFERADALTEDPVQQLLIFLKLLAATMTELEETHPGCLVVTFTYENYQMDEEIRQLVHSGVMGWRHLIGDRLRRCAPPNALPTGVEIDDLADMFTSAVEGGILLSRMFRSNRHLVQQILLYRDYLRRLFGAARNILAADLIARNGSRACGQDGGSPYSGGTALGAVAHQAQPVYPANIHGGIHKNQEQIS